MSKVSVKVSVVVPVYKVPEQFLRKCINSLTAQSLKEIEIILVDDGSPDNCGKICDEYAKKDSRIKVIHQKNKGLCGARNSGTIAATGEWIAYVDGDDWIDKDTYKTLIENTDDSIDLICFGFCKDYGSTIIKNDYSKYFENGKVYKTEEEIKYMLKMILNFKANCAMVPTKFIRRKFIVDNNIYHDEALRQGAEGIEFNIRMFNKVSSFKFLDNSFYHYTYNDNSITTTHNEENHRMVLNCFSKIKKEIDCSEKDLMSYYYNRLVYVIITTALSGYFNVTNTEKYRIKKMKYKKYLQNSIVEETFKKANLKSVDKQRQIIFILIKYRCFLLISLIAKINYLIKQNKKEG